ncbi:hypothetical protein ACQ4PT_006460 [Festuca glaucescens]
MAEQLGAVCCSEVDSTVTHVFAVHVETVKARWAVKNKKFLLHPRWMEACNYRWSRQWEEIFPVPCSKKKGKEKVLEDDVATVTDILDAAERAVTERDDPQQLGEGV